MVGHSFNHIAKDYHSKRKKPWRPFEFFLDYLRKKGFTFEGISLDLGAANGRNFKIIGTIPKKVIGIDISLELLKIAKEDLKNPELYSRSESNHIQILQADIRYLPIRENSIHNIFSIAAIHHIKSKSDRKNLTSQLNRILIKNGNLIITVWRKWQKEYRSYFLLDFLKRIISSKHKEQQKIAGLGEFGDKFVPWTLSINGKAYNRFYHFFSKKEIIKLLKSFRIRELKLTGGPNNRDNFFIFAQKSTVNDK